MLYECIYLSMHFAIVLWEFFMQMEVPFDLGEYFEDAPIQRLDLNTLKRLNPRKCWPVQRAIDGMGALSAEVAPFA